MPICPQGHDSPTEDYCDVCGLAMAEPAYTPPAEFATPPSPGGVRQAPAAPAAPAAHPAPAQHATATVVRCPICNTVQTERYCEECGYDYELSSPSQRARFSPPAAGYGHPQPQSAQAQPPSYAGSTSTGPSGYGYPPSSAPSSAPSPAASSGPNTDFILQPPPGAAPAPAPASVPAQTPAPASTPSSEQPYANLPGFGPPQSHPQQETPTPTWVAVVNADRDYFSDTMARSGPDAHGLNFPPYSPERRVPMTGRGQLRIGRRSQHRGTIPEIDLSSPPEDPGASHNHALLQEQPDGAWVVIDQDSTNGTTLNGGPDPISPHVPIPLKDGDRIHIGAWTTITIHRA